MKKRGIGHVEMIISFILFISAIVFVVLFFKPQNSTTYFLESSLKSVSLSFEDVVSVEMEKYSVIVKNNEVGNAVEILGIAGDMNARVLDSNGNVLDSEKDNNIIYFLNPKKEKVVYVNFCEEFDNSKLPSGIIKQKHDSSSYLLGSSMNVLVLSEKKIKEMRDLYESDYNGFKEKIGVLDNADFGFSLVFLNGSRIEAQKEIYSGANVFSSMERKEMLNTAGDSVYVDLITRIW